MNTFCNVIVSNSLIVGVMALGVMLLGCFWKNRIGLHICWMLVLAKLWLPPVVMISVPWLEIVGNSPKPVSSDAATEIGPTLLDGASSPAAAVGAPQSALPRALPVRGASAVDRIVVLFRRALRLDVLACVWTVGSLGLIVRYGLATLRFRRLLLFAKPAPSAVCAMASAISGQLGLRLVPIVVTVPVRVSPLVWAFGGRPRVVLPSALFQRLDAGAMRAILVHELAHIRRKDHVVRLLEILTTIAFWWHPVTWIASRKLRELEEECCDSVVLQSLPSETKTYAIALVDTLDFLAAGPAMTPLVATTVRPTVSLERRIRMLHQSVPVARPKIWQLLLLATIAAFPMAVAAKVPAEKVAAEAKKQVTSGVPAAPVEGAQEKKPKTIMLYTAVVDDADVERLNRIVATHSITVRGRATDPAGKPIPGATIRLLSLGGGELSPLLGLATTDADGRYEIIDAKLPIRGAELPHGQFQISGTAPGRGIAWIGQRYFDAANRPKGAEAKNHPHGPNWLYAEDPLVFDLTLGQEASIRGRLIDDMRQAIRAAQVKVIQCQGTPKNEGDFEDRYLHGSVDLPATTSDDDGRFLLRGLANETVVVLAISHPEFGNRGLRVVLADKPVVFPDRRDRDVFSGDLNLTLQRAQEIRGRLLYGDTDQPARQASVGAWRRDNLDIYASGKSDDAGDFTLSLPPGTYELNIKPDRMTMPPGYIATKISLAVTGGPRDQPQVLSLPRASTLDLAVVDADTGHGIPRVSIATQRDQDDQDLWLIVGWTDADGKLNKLVEPGRRRYGSVSPRGYVVVEEPRELLELTSGKTTTVLIKLRKQADQQN